MLKEDGASKIQPSSKCRTVFSSTIMSVSGRFVSKARSTMDYRLKQCKENDHDGRLAIFEEYSKSVIGHFLNQWRSRQLMDGMRRWLHIDFKYRIQLLDERVTKTLLHPASKTLLNNDQNATTEKEEQKEQEEQEEREEQEEQEEVQVFYDNSSRTMKEIEDVIEWLQLWYKDKLLLSQLNKSGLQHLGEAVGPICAYKPGQRIFHDSDPPNTLGLWVVLSGSVTLSTAVDSKKTPKNVVLNSGDKFTSKLLTLQSKDFSCACADEEFDCYDGFMACSTNKMLRKSTDDEMTEILFITKDCFIKSIGLILLKRKTELDRSKKIERFLKLLVGNKFNDDSDISLNIINRLTNASFLEKFNRKSTVQPKSLHLGIADEGTFTVYAKSKSDKPGQRTQVAVITEVGGIVSCTAEDANDNKKIAKKGFTRFEHEIVVSSSEASIIWIPLNSLDGTSSSSSTLRKALSSILEKQAKQRLDRTNAAASTLNNLSVSERNRRRAKAANILQEANTKAENLKKHIASFMDWKKEADEEMSFSDLDLSPARPSLSVVSPVRSRWTWNHQQRDLKNESSRSSQNSNNRNKSSPSKYAVRKTYN
jgi:hypothetical protein